MGATFAAVVIPAEALQEGLAEERLWVAIDSQEQRLGFALAGVVAGSAHLEELDVVPEYGRQGIGTALAEMAAFHHPV